MAKRWRNVISIVIIAAFFAMSLLAGCGQVQKPPAADKQQSARAVSASQGAVAAAHPLAAEVGLNVLKKGGNAFDAAVAAAFSLGVVEPNASGIGGGGFAILYVAKEKKSYVVDFREVAPKKATADFYKRDEKGKVLNGAMATGWYSTAVPGEIAGLDLINKKFGTMKWADLIEPAAKQAEVGIIVSQTLAKIVSNEFDRMQKFPSQEFFNKTFLKDGLPVQKDEKIENKELAQTLRKIAKGGADVFYKGEIADMIAKAYEKDGNGFISKEDLASYKAAVYEPLKGTYRGYTVEVLPPPSSGGLTVLEMLNMLEGYDISKMKWGSPEHLHSFLEAQKLAYADRTKYIADPAFLKVPSKGLLNKKYADELRKTIDAKKAATDVKAGNPNPFESSSTTSFSVIDKDGNMVSITKSINHFLGSGVVPAGTGIMMNDTMDDFDKLSGQINSPEPGKRPLSSMSPVVVSKDGKPVITLGSPGASRIITAVANVLINIIDFKMDMQSAIEAARYHFNGKSVSVESRINPETLKALEGMGHKIDLKDKLDLYFGGVQGIMYGSDGKLHGGADPRRDGIAVGY